MKAVDNYEDAYIRLNIYMKDMGYSRADVCYMTGICSSHLTRILDGRASLTPLTAAKLKKAGFPTRWICYGF
jgi:plasmid maintenance system antidote protein VapI